MKAFKRALCRKAACIGLTAAMASTFVAGQVLATPSKGSVAASADYVQSIAFENANGTVNLTDIKLNNFNSKVFQSTVADYMKGTRSVIVTLNGKPLSERANGDEGYLTSYEGELAAKEIAAEQKKFLSELKQAGIPYKLRSSYDAVVNAVAIDVDLSLLSSVKGIKGVSSVAVSSTYARPDSVESEGGGGYIDPESIYANGIYNSSAYTAQGINGKGMKVAILDTGIDYTHEAFLPSQMEQPLATVEEGLFTYDVIEQKMQGGDFKATQRSNATATDVYVNEKIPYAYDYADSDSDVYPSYSQHGTHVAGIVGGKADSYTDKDGYVAKDSQGNVLPFRGVAPEAQLVICKVFTDNLDDKDLGGAETVDIVDALDDCYKLGVDIINMSLGTSSGFPTSSLGLSESDTEGNLLKGIYTRLWTSGITMMVAASNEFSAGYGSDYGTNLATNPDSGTVGSPSTFSGAMSVASINGQLAKYLLANGTDPVYYEESRNEDSDAYNFLDEMLGSFDPKSEYYTENPLQSMTCKYVYVQRGDAGDYTSKIKSILNNKKEGEKVIVLVERGGSPFKDKIATAILNKADAVIVFNNVAGMIRMSLGNLKIHIPSISISLEAGRLMTENGTKTEGTITLDRSLASGPYMNDYSSWGTTPDLQLKPDITSHGGEITSSVAGGYDEQSGTSMACPNLAGFTALLKNELKKNNADLWNGTVEGLKWQAGSDAFNLTKLTNNVIMSTATTVYDHNDLPYSPRKQGAGLATLKNVFNTGAYLFTDATKGDMCQDGRPKAELKSDVDKKGEYKMTFYVHNFSDGDLSFRTKSIFMTETLSLDGKAVAEKAHVFSLEDEEYTVQWKCGGNAVNEGSSIIVAKHSVMEIEVSIKMSSSAKRYINTRFANGMFVEGFLQLISDNADSKQCSLNFPYMGFFGDWKAAPMLDMDCFEVADYESDGSLNDDKRPKPSVWATQPYGYYQNEKFTVPLGSYLYVQDEGKEHTNEYVYTDEEHIVISRFNDYYGETDDNNYLTITGIKALYAGLLRNAELVAYTLTNVDTGEIIPDANGNAVREVYRVPKAFASGGSPIPAQVLLELRTDELGLAANGKYRLDFSFYFDYDDYKDGKETDETFSMSFYVDYEAPVLVDASIKYQNVKKDNKDTQRVTLNLDVFDNTYPQAVILCYSDTGDIRDKTSLKLATEYIVPIINPDKNTVSSVSVDITDIYDEYKGKLFIELDDYALNHNVYVIDLAHAQTNVCTSDFTIAEGSEITIAKNLAKKLTLENIGSANISNFVWRSTNEEVVKVQNGEIFGVAPGTAIVAVTGGNGSTQSIKVTVNDSSLTLRNPALTFGTIINHDDRPVRSESKTPELSGIQTVEVNSGQRFKLNLFPEPWYYPMDDIGELGYVWESTDEEVATVDGDGVVTVEYQGDKARSAVISARSVKYPSCVAMAEIAPRDPFTVSNNVLTRYRGWGGELKESVEVGGKIYTNVRLLQIPAKKSVTEIGEDAFKEAFDEMYSPDESGVIIVLTKTITKIDRRAFLDCRNLLAVCFIDTVMHEPADSSLTMISAEAFKGCEDLEILDLSNCKIITVDRNAFSGCESLERVVKMGAIGTMYREAFKDCTKLASADLTDLHVAGDRLFAGCTALTQITTGANTVIGKNMFDGCTALERVEINCPVVGDGAFARCTSLRSVKFGCDVTVGSHAFASCSALTEVEFDGCKAVKLGDYAFRNCTSLKQADFGSNLVDTVMGRDVFAYDMCIASGAVTDGEGRLILAPKIIDAPYAFGGITEIAEYAFSGSVITADGDYALDLTDIHSFGEGAFAGLKGLTSVTLPAGITEIPAYAFAGTGLKSITIPHTVTKIGESAFADCTALTTVTYEGASALTEIGESAFAGSALAGELTLPDGVTKIGSTAFASCTALTAVNLPSVKEMGEGVFMNCTSLVTATYGAQAEVTGEYTFLAYDPALGQVSVSALKNVTLGGKVTEIGKGAFANCTSLTKIDLPAGIKTVGEEAFFGCIRLAQITNLDKVGDTDDTGILPKDLTASIGPYAFENCMSLTSVNLASAKRIGYRAFFNCRRLASVTFSNSLQTIGDEAFAENALASVTIPAGCTYVGVSAFAGNSALSAFTVEEGEGASYVAIDGVLYRNIEGIANTYELAAYPTNKTAAGGVYEIVEGTVAIGAFAFYGIDADKINKVVLPYTVKVIGNGAFFGCGIENYEFRSVVAPTLLEGRSDRVIVNDYSTNSLFYNNFMDYLANCTPHQPGAEASYVSTIAILYPENGVGYDNFIYKNYFGLKATIDEQPEDATRRLGTLLEEIEAEKDAVLALTPAGDEVKAMVVAFANKVIEAHEMYNDIHSESQLAFVGEEKIAKLFAVEEALKPVKAQFGIRVAIDRITVDESSTHKTSYKPGQKFNLSGLKILVTYDDYSYEIIDAIEAGFIVDEEYDRPLDEYDRTVKIVAPAEYGRDTLTILVDMSGASAPEQTASSKGSSALPAYLIAIIAVGGAVVLAAATFAVVFVLAKKGVIKFKSKQKVEDNGEEGKTDD